MIRCEKINLRFGEKIIFSDLDIAIRKGEHLCLSGASGKGKSTFLKLLQGYVIADSGKVIINGITLNSMTIRQIRRQMAWIPQNINLPVRNGIEVITLMQMNDKLQNIRSIAEILGLESEIISQDFTKISGGQKQRLIISICLAMDKEILLMDEPTASLDADSVQKLARYIGELNGKTIISASHNPFWIDSAQNVYAL